MVEVATTLEMVAERRKVSLAKSKGRGMKRKVLEGTRAPFALSGARPQNSILESQLLLLPLMIRPLDVSQWNETGSSF